MATLDLNTLQELVARGEIDTMIMASVDMQGKLFGKRVPAGYFLESAKDGIHTCAINFIWDASQNFADNYAFCNFDTGIHDIQMIPDLSTLRRYPWSEKTALVLGDLYNKDGSEVSMAPRNMLKKQLAKAKSMGFSVYAASELEFYLFRETSHSVREKHFMDLQPLFPYPIDYSLYRLTVDDWFLGQLVRNLEGVGVPVESLKGEYGNGQVELNIRYAEALEMGDRTAIYKNGVKEMAALNNLMATFMAKHNDNDSGSSGHTHISLWDLEGKQNLFYDPDNEYNLSETGRYFLGGMMALAPVFMIFYAPYINSYKRLFTTAGAPNTLTWGVDNRTTSFRFDGTGKSSRLENRIPGADANSYHVLTACLASGLYGIEQKIDIPQAIQANAYALPDVKRLPSNLVEAVRLLEQDELVRSLLGDDVVDHYLTAANNEINDYFTSVTDWERRRYFEFI